MSKTELPTDIGWKRLFLTRQQKYIYDVNTLGREKDKIQKIIIFFENLSFRSLKRHLRKFIMNLYWILVPKRLKVSERARYGHIQECLPWFKDGKSHKHLYKFNGKIVVASHSPGWISKDYTYSWKKAYEIMKQCQHQMEQEELQAKFNIALRKRGIKNGQ